MRGGGLLDGATVGIERRGTFQMRGGISQPVQTTVVKMRKDGGDGAAAAFMTGKLGAPCARVEGGENELVHGVVGGVGFVESVADFSKGGEGLGSWRHGG